MSDCDSETSKRLTEPRENPWPEMASTLTRALHEMVARIGLEGHGLELEFGKVRDDMSNLTLAWGRKRVRVSTYVTGHEAYMGDSKGILGRLICDLFLNDA